jgi:tRNA-dihydrouridine synthase
MIGRGALGNPEIFAEILGKDITKSKYEIICEHIQLLRQYYPENFISGHIRKHLLWYMKGEVGASSIKVQISTESDINRVLEIIREFLSKK